MAARMMIAWLALLLFMPLGAIAQEKFEGRDAMGYFGTTGRRLKGFIEKVTCHSWLISTSSLVWLLLRTGSNPSRFSYPCQEMARTNIAVFGLPFLYFFLQHFKKCPRLRARTLRGIFLVGLGLALAWGGGIWVANYRLVPISPPVREVYGATKSRVVWIAVGRQ